MTVKCEGAITIRDSDGWVYTGEVTLHEEGEHVRIKIGGYTACIYKGVTLSKAFDTYFDSVRYIDGGISLP